MSISNYYQVSIISGDPAKPSPIKYGPKFKRLEHCSGFADLLMEKKKFPIVGDRCCKVIIYDINSRQEVGSYSKRNGSWNLSSVSESSDALSALMEELFAEVGHEFDLEAEAIAVKRSKIDLFEESDAFSEEEISKLKRKLLR